MEHTRFVYTDDEIRILKGESYLWNVSDAVELHFFDSVMEFRVVHKNYFTENKVVLMPTEILCLAQFDTEKNGYISSSLRKFVNTIVSSGFLPEIRKAMTDCNVECYDGHKSLFIKDKIFVPSVTECGILHNEYIVSEGQQFDYFKTSENRKIFDGTSNCWTRTQDIDHYDGAWSVYINICSSAYHKITHQCGVLFAFEV